MSKSAESNAALTYFNCLRKTNQRQYGAHLKEPFTPEFIERSLFGEKNKRPHELISRPSLGLSEFAQTLHEFHHHKGVDQIFHPDLCTVFKGLCPKDTDVAKMIQDTKNPERCQLPHSVESATNKVLDKVSALTDKDIKLLQAVVSGSFAAYATASDLLILHTVMKKKPEVKNTGAKLMAARCEEQNKTSRVDRSDSFTFNLADYLDTPQVASRAPFLQGEKANVTFCSF
jgi:hypothetical protein